jgi:precorrin-6B methylase 2
MNIDMVKRLQSLYRGNRLRDSLHINNTIYCPHVATKKCVSYEIIQLVSLKTSDRFLDIGSGDGTVIYEIMKCTLNGSMYIGN